MSSDVLHRGARGAMALGLRQVLVQFLSLAAAIVLARILTTAEFGIYGITVFLMHFLVIFGDAGLAAGLVREPGEPDERDYRAVFTFQQVLVAATAVVGIFCMPQLSQLLAPQGGLGHLLPALIAALVLSSFQTTAVARLERHLEFDKLAVVEVGQALAFNGVVVGCALAGLGADAMAAALVARAAIGVVLVQVVAPWSIAWAWDWARVKSRLRFGLSFQGAALVNMLRDAMLPVFVGALLGSAAVGEIFFARMLAIYPFLVIYMVQRLLMPMFARLQDRPQDLKRAVELSLFAVAALVIPVQVAVWSLQEPLTRIVFGEQWLMTLPVYRWLWLSLVLEPQLVVVLALFNAIGRADRTFRLVVWTTVIMWVAGVPLLIAFGPIGFGLASVAQLVVKWPILREGDAAARINSLLVVAPIWAAGLVAALMVTAVRAVWEPSGVVGLAALLLLSLAAFGSSLLMAAPRRSRAAMVWVRSWWNEASAGRAT